MADELEFDFSLLDHASNPAGRIDDSLGDVLDVLKDIRKGLGQFESESRRSFDQAGASTVALGSIYAEVFGGAVRLLGNAGMAVVRFAADSAIAFGEASLGAAAFRETSELALSALRHGDGVAQFERIKDIALDMGTPLQETAKQFQKLAAMQFSESEAETFFRRMQDLRAVGSDAEQTKRALVAITQIKSAGKLQGDELNQLAEAGVSVQLVLEEIGKATGKSIAEVVKLKEAGKVTADVALNAIERAIGKKTGAQVAGDAGRAFIENTVQGMSERIANLKDVIFDDIAKAFQPAFRELLPVLGRALDRLESDEFKAFVDDLGDGFGRVVNAATRLEPVVADVFAALTGDSASSTIDAVAGGFEAIVLGVERAWPVVQEFAIGFEQGFGDAWVQLKELAKALGAAFGGGDMENSAELARALGVELGKVAVAAIGFAGALASIAGIGVAVIGALEGLFLWFQSVPLKISEAGFEIGVAIREGLVRALDESIASVRAAASRLAGAIPEPIRDLLGIHSPSRVAYDLGWNTGEGLAGGQWDAVPMVSAAANDMGSAATPIILPTAPDAANDMGSAAPFIPSPRAAVGAGRSSMRLNARVNQNFTIQSGESGSKLAEQIASEGRRGYDAGLESLALQFGVG